MKNFIKSIAGFLIVVGVLFLWINYSQISCWFNGVGGLDLLTFIITLAAFLAATYAIWQQHEAGVKQEIIGAWQVLANKASGNSGKIEAIEFLAKQGKSLQGIDMSNETHEGRVCLNGLNLKNLGVDLAMAHFEGASLRKAHFENVKLSDAHFESAILGESHFEDAYLAIAHFQGAYLRGVNFKCVDLAMADFKDADLSGAHFAGSNLDMAEFKNSKFFDEAIFDEDNYVSSENLLPPTPEDSKHKFEFILNDGEKKSEPKLDKNGKPTGATKYFIHLVPKTQNS